MISANYFFNSWYTQTVVVGYFGLKAPIQRKKDKPPLFYPNVFLCQKLAMKDASFIHYNING